MRATRLAGAFFAAGGLFLAPRVASAQENPQSIRQEIEQLRSDFEALKQRYDVRLTALESRLAALGERAGEQTALAPTGVAQTEQAGTPPPAAPTGGTAEVPGGAADAGAPGGSLPVYGSAVAGSRVFNPDLAVIGNFLGAAGSNAVNPEPALQMRETEISLQAIVDPYARADFFVAIGPEGAAIEEGYLTLPTLPAGLLVKVGKMKAAFGKVNTLHPHVLPWTDRPLVTSLLGGDEGLNDAGISVARLIPNRWLFLEATGQVFRGESGGVFAATRRSDLSYLGHLRAYQDITEDSNVDLGFSYSRGHNAAGIVDGEDIGRSTTALYGIDATYRWKPLARSIYRSFIARSEVIWSRRGQPAGLQAASGFYASGEYQFARRWRTGARFDRSGRAEDARLTDSGQSLILTYWPSEFSQVRGQYRRTKYALGQTANEFLFQFQFAMGAHGAHPF